MSGYGNIADVRSDLEMSQFNYFSRYKKYHQRRGGCFRELDTAYKKVQDRYDFLMTGAELPQKDTIDAIDDMSDAELREQMAMLQAIMDARKRPEEQDVQVRKFKFKGLKVKRGDGDSGGGASAP